MKISKQWALQTAVVGSWITK